MNVSELTDTELNRAMIWLYPPSDSVTYSGDIDMYLSRYRSMDYLSSYDLTMPLAVENELDMDFDTGLWQIYAPSASYSKNKNLIRAICETLVMIAMESKK